MFQQGDVIIKRVPYVADGARQVPITDGRFVLAEGEATGHNHTVDCVTEAYVLDDASTIEEFMLAHVEDAMRPFPEQLVFVVCDDGATVRHTADHYPVPVETGINVSWQVREYDHFAEEARTVVD